MPAPDKLLNLIEVFDRNAEAYRRGSINETETRVQFIDPLFELLGWDVRNTCGHSEAFKDVVDCAADHCSEPMIDFAAAVCYNT